MLRVLRCCLGLELLNLARKVWPEGELEDVAAQAAMVKAEAMMGHAAGVTARKIRELHGNS